MKPTPNKKEQILQATLDLIQEHGLNQLTTAKIARRSDTAETIIYRHFSGKQEILGELLQRVGRDFQKDADSILQENLSPFEKLTKLSSTHLNFISNTKGISRILFSEQIHLAVENDPLKLEARQLNYAYRNCVKKLIAEGKQKGDFVSDLDEETASRSFMGIHYLLMHEWTLDNFSWDLPGTNMALVNYYINAWSPSPSTRQNTTDT